eukprot:6174199-Pleurochrysis_carterae.AAC.1
MKLDSEQRCHKDSQKLRYSCRAGLKDSSERCSAAHLLSWAHRFESRPGAGVGACVGGQRESAALARRALRDERRLLNARARADDDRTDSPRLEPMLVQAAILCKMRMIARVAEHNARVAFATTMRNADELVMKWPACEARGTLDGHLVKPVTVSQPKFEKVIAGINTMPLNNVLKCITLPSRTHESPFCGADSLLGSSPGCRARAGRAVRTNRRRKRSATRRSGSARAQTQTPARLTKLLFRLSQLEARLCQLERFSEKIRSTAD